jgi:hypothetical protein
MTEKQQADLSSLEGRRVSVALRDGSRIDDSQLVSAGRGGVGTLWLFTSGTDTFVPHEEVVDLWESLGV